MSATILLIDECAERRRLLRAAVERRGFRVAGEAAGPEDLVPMIASLSSPPSTVLVGAGCEAAAAVVKRVFPKTQVLSESQPALELAAV